MTDIQQKIEQEAKLRIISAQLAHTRIQSQTPSVAELLFHKMAGLSRCHGVLDDDDGFDHISFSAASQRSIAMLLGHFDNQSSNSESDQDNEPDGNTSAWLSHLDLQGPDLSNHVKMADMLKITRNH